MYFCSVMVNPSAGQWLITTGRPSKEGGVPKRRRTRRHRKAAGAPVQENFRRNENAVTVGLGLVQKFNHSNCCAIHYGNRDTR